MKRISKLLSKNYLIIVFLISGVATFGSLFFSDVQSLTPCVLCWYQRILMYPIFMISAVSLSFDQPASKKVLLTLSIPGLLLALYNYLIQIFPVPHEFVVCTGGVDCSKIDWTLQQVINFEPFKYVTIPGLSFLAFLSIIILVILRYWHSKKNH